MTENELFNKIENLRTHWPKRFTRSIDSLEMRMKCGIGKCGRCNIGSKFVCIDGPVFSLAELKKMPNEY